MNPTNILLKDAFKSFTLDQDKVVPPEKTVKQFKEKLTHLDFELLQETIRIDNGRLDIPVFISVCGEDARAATGTSKQMGKGATTPQAEASAVMELAERFSFFSFCNNPRNFFVDTFQNVNDRAISFDRIAQSVHDDSDTLPLAKEVFERLPLKWTTAYSLTRKEPVLIPFNWFFTINEFNGPSAGNCVEEALLQGICEVVERHVSSIISHNQLEVPAIRPESARDAKVVEMLTKYRQNGIQLYLSDFTLDMGIPSVGALAYDPTTFPETSEIVWTAGTTPDPQKALSRTLTEVAQLAGDFNSDANYVASGLPKFTTLEAAKYVMRGGESKNINDLPDLSHNNIKVEVERCVAALAAKDMEVIVVNTMHPQLEIPAFYTVIPGAHFRERAHGTSVGMFTAKLMAEGDDPIAAVRDLEDFERKLPGQYYTMFYLGNCHLSLGHLDTAMNYFKKSLNLEPTKQDIPSIYAYMGICLKEMEKYHEAIEMLKQGEACDAERTDIFNLMGFCYFKLKKHEHAIDCFKKVLALNPSSAIDYANIASNYRDMGNTEKAIRYYETALSIDPGIEFARDNLSKLKNLKKH